VIRGVRASIPERFRVRRKLKDALYGSVFCCSDEYFPGEFVAVKHISLSFAKGMRSQGTAMDDPWEERRVASILIAAGGHPNVLRFQNYFLHQKKWLFFVMEFCKGGDLFESMSKLPNQRFEERQALRMITQVVRGVQFLHENDVAHRDLSLENVLLQDGICKICDFGLSTNSRRICTEKVGKAYYMAPEVEAETAYDPMTADIWSLGIMLFMMLTGSPLVQTANASDKAFCVVAKFGVVAVLRAWNMNSSFSYATLHLLTRLLQVDPSKRISTHEILDHPAVLWAARSSK
jgi:serine/threonine protein kinase